MIRAMRLTAAAVVAVAVAALTPARAVAQQTVTCSSTGHDRAVCGMDTRGGVQLVRQLSDAPCVRGRSWGVLRNAVWVSRGCRAQFRAGEWRDGRRDDRDDRYDRDRRGTLTAGRAAASCRLQIRREYGVRHREIEVWNGRRLRDGDYRLEWRARRDGGVCTVDARTGRVSLRYARERR